MAELAPIRRIVTSHNEKGVAVVQSDEHFFTKVRTKPTTFTVVFSSILVVAYGGFPWCKKSANLDLGRRSCQGQ